MFDNRENVETFEQQDIVFAAASSSFRDANLTSFQARKAEREAVGKLRRPLVERTNTSPGEARSANVSPECKKPQKQTLTEGDKPGSTANPLRPGVNGTGPTKPNRGAEIPSYAGVAAAFGGIGRKPGDMRTRDNEAWRQARERRERFFSSATRSEQCIHKNREKV
ncbi:hypothetical protein R1sor_009064 [Riccia sorocarpa]|uniref:Uncharacterized protein n=1 Tax=Riccia sorocarpa TaxID=122646 RepID=A0ABD3H4R0_9MARC